MTSRADPRGSVRQAAAIITLVAAGAATLATSPPYQSVRLVEQAGGRVRLDSAHPSASGTVSIRLSPEALPSSSGGTYANGSVTIRVGTVGSAGAPGAATFQLTASPQGSTPALTVNGQQATAHIEDLCERARLCELTYVVAFEMDGPLPAGGIDVPWSVEASVTYSGRDIVPEGAAVKVNEVQPLTVAPAPPGLEARLADEEISLSVDHPMLVRHVALELSATGATKPVETPTTSVMEVATTWLDRPATARFDPAPFDVLVVPDDAALDLGPAGTTLPHSIGNRFEPFATCVPNRACRRGVAIVFEWLDDDPAAVHRVSWTSMVRVRYPGLEALPKGATLTARVDDRRSAGPPAASLHVEAHKRIRMMTAQGGRADGSGRLVFVANAEALPGAELGPLPPPSVALITVSVVRADGAPIAGSAIHISLNGPGVLPSGTGGGSQAGMEPARPFPVFPLRICEAGQPCQVEVGLSVWVQDQAAPIPVGTPLDIVVDVDATLPYLDLGAPPARGELTVDVVDSSS